MIGILHRMQEEFKASLKDITTAEDAALADFQGLVAAKEKEIQAATEAIESKTARAGEAAVRAASLSGRGMHCSARRATHRWRLPSGGAFECAGPTDWRRL